MTAKYKGFCNAIIGGLQLRGRGRDPRQRRVLIENPARDAIELRDEAARVMLYSPKRSRLLSIAPDSFWQWIRPIPAFDSKQTGTRKGKTGGKGAHATHCASKWN